MVCMWCFQPRTHSRGRNCDGQLSNGGLEHSSPSSQEGVLHSDGLGVSFSVSSFRKHCPRNTARDNALQEGSLTWRM